MGSASTFPSSEKSLENQDEASAYRSKASCKNLGYTGGLKGCEKKLGIDRHELDGVNGYFAVLLWYDYRKKNNQKALDTLLAYNTLDAVNLHQLMVTAYNLKLKETPFYEEHRLELPEPVQNPFEADVETLERIRERIGIAN